MLKTSLRCHVSAVGKATNMAQAAGPLMAIGRAIGLAMPGVVEDFTARRTRMISNGGFGEIFGHVDVAKPYPGGESGHLSCPIGRACRVTIDPFAWRVDKIFESRLLWDAPLDAFYRRTSERAEGDCRPQGRPGTRRHQTLSLDAVLFCLSVCGGRGLE